MKAQIAPITVPVLTDITTAKKGKRKTKLQLTEGKVRIRPGHITTGPPSSRTFTITIPPEGKVGTVEEEAQVKALADNLKTHKEVGVVTANGINNGSWQIVMRLAAPATATDEEALDAAFEVLVPVFNDCALLQTGFGEKKPRWRYSGKDHMDSGYF